MKNKFNHTNYLFSNAIKADMADLKPNKAIEERLNYYFMLKRSSHKVHSNSFSGMFVWLLSLKGLGIKAGFATICLTYCLFFGNIKDNNNIPQFSDTCQITPQLVDSFYLAKDSCK
jgi:hypothetical protein